MHDLSQHQESDAQPTEPPRHPSMTLFEPLPYFDTSLYCPSSHTLRLLGVSLPIIHSEPLKLFLICAIDLYFQEIFTHVHLHNYFMST